MPTALAGMFRKVLVVLATALAAMAVRRFLRDNNALRVSRSLRDTAYRAMQSREELEKQLGREPTVDEIAQKTGLSRREVSAALESVVEPLSLEEPVYADGGDAVYIIFIIRFYHCSWCPCLSIFFIL